MPYTVEEIIRSRAMSLSIVERIPIDVALSIVIECLSEEYNRLQDSVGDQFALVSVTV